MKCLLIKLPNIVYASIVRMDNTNNFLIRAIKNGTEVNMEQEKRASHKCFHCGCETVAWDADFDYSDMGYDGEGIVHICHCTKCGAEIEYRIASDTTPTNKSLCDSCIADGCIFQSGIVRSHCGFYKAGSKSN